MLADAGEVFDGEIPVAADIDCGRGQFGRLRDDARQ